MLSFTDADIQRLDQYEEQNKVLRSRCNEQDEKRKQLLARIQCAEEKLQQKARQSREKLQQKARQSRTASSHNDSSFRKQQEARLEEKIREQRRAKEILERELSILKHAPHLVALRAPLKHVLGMSPVREKLGKSPLHRNAEDAAVAAESQDDLKRVVDALGNELKVAVATIQRLKRESELELSASEDWIKSSNPNHESLSEIRLQVHEVGFDIKAIEDREEQTAIALRSVKDNDPRLISEVEFLTSQLASQSASVASLQRQKEVNFLPCSTLKFFKFWLNFESKLILPISCWLSFWRKIVQHPRQTNCWMILRKSSKNLNQTITNCVIKLFLPGQRKLRL
jgi:hypothetical protein